MADSSAVDLIAILPNVTKDFCVAINDKLGVINPSGDPPQDPTNANVTDIFNGSYTYQYYLDGADVTSTTTPHTEACFEGSGTPPAGTYHYYRVLLSR